MPAQVYPYGDEAARIMLVGEAPSRNEALSGKMYSSTSGKELGKMLHEAGLLLSDCYVTSVCRVPIGGKQETKRFFTKLTKLYQVPLPEVSEGLELLKKEIGRVQPDLIIALGDLALWALTGELGITKWRGSLLQTSPDFYGTKVIPTYAPDVVQRKWDWRFIAVQDFRRCATELNRPIWAPEYKFSIRPVFSEVMDTLERLCHEANTHAAWDGFDAVRYIDTPTEKPAENGSNQTAPLMLSGDIETRGGHIACLGIGWSKTEAICIPFICVENKEGYWNEAEETAIVLKLYELFTHPSTFWVFQNGLYDYQYFAYRWGFIPRIGMDTMLAQHTCFAGLPKGLDFQSSMYCEYHRYWKDEGKEFHEGIKTPSDENTYWVYNCKDCVTTYEIALTHVNNLNSMNAWEPYLFQMRQFMPVLRMMLRGVRVDRKKKAALLIELTDAIAEREQWLTEVLGSYINPKSPKQMQKLFYEELGLPVQKVRKTGRPTTNDDALQTLAKKEPLVEPLVRVFSELRSLNVFLSTFVKAPVSDDGRIRSSYNIAGTETFRWSSSTDAFGKGMNLQNIPKGNE